MLCQAREVDPGSQEVCRATPAGSHRPYSLHQECAADVYRRTHKFLEPIELHRSAVDGKISASYNSITLHWVTDNRNISNVSYDDGLIRLSGIDLEKLPDLQPANSVLGNLSPRIAADWGMHGNIRSSWARQMCILQRSVRGGDG